MTCMRAWMSSKFGRIRPRTTELAALERMKKIPLTYNGENDVITFSPLFIPPQTVFVGGYTVFTLSVRPNERPSDLASVTLCFLNILKNH